MSYDVLTPRIDISKFKTKSLEAFYGLPSEVKFCAECTISNQRPCSEVEFTHNIKTKKRTHALREDGICDACRYHKHKSEIDWEAREQELIRLLDKHRKNNGEYDCIVPGSGGRDSAYQAHILKYKYGMNPLTVTWQPILYTDYGYKNYQNWIDVGGLDNISFRRNGRVMKLLTRLSIENLLHPFQTFILGQKNLGPKIAAKFGIPLLFYGENEAEYGNPIADNNSSLRDKSYYSYKHFNELHLGGVSVEDLMSDKYKLTRADLSPFLPLQPEELERSQIEVHYLGYYLKWVPQETYYYAVENTGFRPRPFRSQGTYTKYVSIDDKIDDLHYYTTYMKFGLGRCSYETSHEIRNKHITLEEGKALVARFDGEFPDRYFQEVMDYLEIDTEHFFTLCDKFRSPHIWGIDSAGKWKLRHTVNLDGLED